MRELIHESTGRVKRCLLLLMLLLLLLFEGGRRSQNWSASKTIVETFGFRCKLVAGLEKAFVLSDAIRHRNLLLLLVEWKRKTCRVGEFSIENAVRVLMELFRCIHVVVRRTADAIGVAVVVVAHVAGTLKLVHIHQLSHEPDIFVVEIIVQAVVGRSRHYRLVMVESRDEHAAGRIVVKQHRGQDGWVCVLLVVLDLFDFGRTTEPRAISVPRTTRSSHLSLAQWRCRRWRCFHQLVPVLFAN